MKLIVVFSHEIKPNLSEKKSDEIFLKMILVSPGPSDSLEELKRFVIESNEETKFNLSNFDTITGFHIQTRDSNIFSIEAGRRKIKKIWSLEILDKLKDFCFIFYDSSFVSTKRIYPNLDLRFSRIILNFGIDQTLKNALLYCQSAISKNVTSTFIKLNEYTKRTDIKAMAGKRIQYSTVAF